MISYDILLVSLITFFDIATFRGGVFFEVDMSYLFDFFILLWLLVLSAVVMDRQRSEDVEDDSDWEPVDLSDDRELELERQEELKRRWS